MPFLFFFLWLFYFSFFFLTPGLCALLFIFILFFFFSVLFLPAFFRAEELGIALFFFAAITVPPVKSMFPLSSMQSDRPSDRIVAGCQHVKIVQLRSAFIGLLR